MSYKTKKIRWVTQTHTLDFGIMLMKEVVLSPLNNEDNTETQVLTIVNIESNYILQTSKKGNDVNT